MNIVEKKRNGLEATRYVGGGGGGGTYAFLFISVMKAEMTAMTIAIKLRNRAM